MSAQMFVRRVMMEHLCLDTYYSNYLHCSSLLADASDDKNKSMEVLLNSVEESNWTAVVQDLDVWSVVDLNVVVDFPPVNVKKILMWVFYSY